VFLRYLCIAGKEGLRMDKDTNRREFTRVRIHMDVEVATSEAMTIQGRLHDLSMTGIYLSCDTPFPVGTECRAAILLGNPATPMRIETGGRVVRTEDGGMAIHFEEICDLDSFDHLRNLVMSNSSIHTTQVEEEFQSHLGIKPRPGK
jgi:hypothetical protein